MLLFGDRVFAIAQNTKKVFYALSILPKGITLGS